MAIASFKARGLRELFENGQTARIGPNFHVKIIKMLDHMDAATELKDLNGVNDFHELKGDRRGTYSLHVNGNYCITFRYEDGEFVNLDFEDYH